MKSWMEEIFDVVSVLFVCVVVLSIASFIVVLCVKGIFEMFQ